MILDIKVPFDVSYVNRCEQAVFFQEVAIGSADHFTHFFDLLSAHTEVIESTVLSQHLINWPRVNFIHDTESKDLRSISFNQADNFPLGQSVTPGNA